MSDYPRPLKLLCLITETVQTRRRGATKANLQTTTTNIRKTHHKRLPYEIRKKEDPIGQQYQSEKLSASCCARFVRHQTASRALSREINSQASQSRQLHVLRDLIESRVGRCHSQVLVRPPSRLRHVTLDSTAKSAICRREPMKIVDLRNIGGSTQRKAYDARMSGLCPP